MAGKSSSKSSKVIGKGLATIILAAGEGKRMRSGLPKVLHPICGKSMLYYPVHLAHEVGSVETVIVLGVGAGTVKKILPSWAKVSIQKEQLGTGHATMCGIKKLSGFDGDILILYGDVPLLKPLTIEALIQAHRKKKALVSLISAEFEDPAKYGRIIRQGKKGVVGIVEYADATREQRGIKEINSGIYCVQAEFLKNSLKKLKNDNRQGEYYLTDIIEMAREQGGAVASHIVQDPGEIQGVNDRAELAAADASMRGEILKDLMRQGVAVLDPTATYVHHGVKVGRDTSIMPNVRLEGDTVIGKRCIIDSGCVIVDSVIEDDVHIKPYSVITEAKVRKGSTVGPMAHLRPESDIGKDCRIGNFVEVKKAEIGDGTKASHLTYLGDAKIGKRVNIGCGTITCNYDGEKKHLTVIEDDVFVGSDTQLVAPVTIKKGAYIGSGSTITKDVPSGALAIARGYQKNIEGWAADKNKKKKKGKPKK